MPPSSPEGEKKSERLAQLAKLIESALARHGTSARAIAQRAGIGASHLSKVLKAKRSLNRAKLMVLSDLLGLDRDKVLRLAGFGRVEESPLDLSRVTLLRTLDRFILNVVATPRFYDAALFMWIMNQQPLGEVGVQTQLRPANWANVPAEVASYSYAVGFHDRTPSAFRLSRWSHLCLYRGHALIGRAAGLPREHASLLALLQQAKKRDHPLRLITIDEHLAELLRQAAGFSDHFDVQVIANPDVALDSFVQGTGDLFLGGLPQRLALRKREYCELLVYDKDHPNFYSLHGLICSEQMLAEKRPLLHAIDALWYDTCRRLFSEPDFRRAVFEEICDILERQGVEKHNLVKEDFETLFSPAGAELELFAQTPAQLLDILHSPQV